MTAELWVKRPCKHGESQSHPYPPEEKHRGKLVCHNGTMERLDPGQVVLEFQGVADGFRRTVLSVTVQDVLDALEER